MRDPVGQVSSGLNLVLNNSISVGSRPPNNMVTGSYDRLG